MNEELTEEEKLLIQELREKRNEEKKYRLYIRNDLGRERYVSVIDWNTGEFKLVPTITEGYPPTKFTAEQYPHWKNDFMQVEELHYKLEPDWK